MVNVSVIIPAYNEIRFIQKTLESVVGDADEIILSDNASTDGTSDICQSFANKYPEIKYTRQKENIGAGKNFFYCLEQVTGKYLRNLGAHDVSSYGSTRAMAAIIEKNPDASMVYPKYCIYLNPDDSFNSFSTNNFGEYLLSDSPFIRVKHSIANIADFGIFFSLYKTDMFKFCVNKCQIFPNIISDFYIIAYMAKIGKIISENRSIIYRYLPRFESGLDHLKHIARMINGDDTNVYLWNLICAAELYNLAVDMQNLENGNDSYASEILDIIFKFQYDPITTINVLDGKMPDFLPEKQFIKNDLQNYLHNYLDNKPIPKKSKVSIINNIKYLLPYGLVRYIQEKRKK